MAILSDFVNQILFDFASFLCLLLLNIKLSYFKLYQPRALLLNIALSWIPDFLRCGHTCCPFLHWATFCSKSHVVQFPQMTINIQFALWVQLSVNRERLLLLITLKACLHL